MSLLEEILYQQIIDDKLPKPEREYKFHPKRKWRFDLAWPVAFIAVEIEGGVWVQGRHNRGKGFLNDIEKYNTATILGWKVLRFSGEDIYNGEALKTIRYMIVEHTKVIANDN